MLDGDGLGRGEGGRSPLRDACAAAAAVAVASFSPRLPEKDSMKSFMESTGLDHPVLKPAMLCCLAPRECKDRAAGKGLQLGLRRCRSRKRRRGKFPRKVFLQNTNGQLQFPRWEM